MKLWRRVPRKWIKIYTHRNDGTENIISRIVIRLVEIHPWFYFQGSEWRCSKCIGVGGQKSRKRPRGDQHAILGHVRHHQPVLSGIR